MNSLYRWLYTMIRTYEKNDCDIPLQMLLLFENSPDAWSVKIGKSNYIYANAATFDMLNLPHKFIIDGLRDEDIPHPSAEFADFFYQQDINVLTKQKEICSFDVHPYGKQNIIQPFICRKYPFYNKDGICTGVINHACRKKFFSSLDFFLKKKPFSLLLTPPEEIFTLRELDILFFMIRNFSSKRIAQILKLSHRTIETRKLVMYEKVNVHSLNEFIDFCESRGFDEYMPPRLIFRSSKII